MSETNAAGGESQNSGEESVIENDLSGEAGAEGAGEQGEEAAAPEKQPAKEERVVPLAALHEERNARKELQRQLNETRQQQAARDAVIERRLQALANPQQETQVPDKVDAPVDYLDHRLEQISAQQRAILEREQQRDQQSQQQAARQQLANTVIQQRVAFEREAPDLPDAAAHLHSVRVRQLSMLGVPEDRAAQQATAEMDNALLQWAYEGRNAAQTAYEFAKASGYAPKAPTAQSPAEKIESQRRGTAAARSLGGGGAPNAGKLTAEALANMSEEDFSKLTEAQFRQAMGG
jgi:hypothetical protein